MDEQFGDNECDERFYDVLKFYELRKLRNL